MLILNYKKNRKISFVTLCIVLFSLASFRIVNAVNMDAIIQNFTLQHSDRSLNVFNAWKTMTIAIKDEGIQEKLKRVNEFFNRRITWGDDRKIWQQTDYWATPLETIDRKAGDCEDFAIAKYFSLLAIGEPISKLRLVYVKARGGFDTDTTTAQAHMVLAYYETPDSDPLILDNLISEIRPTSRRPDLTPIFSFNSDGIYIGQEGNPGNVRLSRWQDLLQRAHLEGFD